jgi:tRNA threonylcarbamoyladenosine dehydratase
MDILLKNITHRTEMVVGREGMARLSKIRVIVFGVGGVGSWCAESLVRSGVMNLTIVDSDIVCATNINRQIQATSVSVGQVKVDEMKKRLLEINPFAQITAINKAYEEKSADEFDLKSFDYVIDAIDSLKNKILLLEKSYHAGVTFYSSMGAGAKLDPSRIKADKLENTINCPLARHVRREMRKRNIPMTFLCIYSDELPVDPQTDSMCGTDECTCTGDRAEHCGKTGTEMIDWCSRKKRINGALVHITAIFGFMLAGLVIRDAIKSDRD